MYKKGAGNDKQGKDAGNRTLCPYKNFSQAIIGEGGGGWGGIGVTSNTWAVENVPLFEDGHKYRTKVLGISCEQHPHITKNVRTAITTRILHLSFHHCTGTENLPRHLLRGSCCHSHYDIRLLKDEAKLVNDFLSAMRNFALCHQSCH